jgi:hypothetical protein
LTSVDRVWAPWLSKLLNTTDNAPVMPPTEVSNRTPQEEWL